MEIYFILQIILGCNCYKLLYRNFCFLFLSNQNIVLNMSNNIFIHLYLRSVFLYDLIFNFHVVVLVINFVYGCCFSIESTICGKF